MFGNYWAANSTVRHWVKLQIVRSAYQTLHEFVNRHWSSVNPTWCINFGVFILFANESLVSSHDVQYVWHIDEPFRIHFELFCNVLFYLHNVEQWTSAQWQIQTRCRLLVLLIGQSLFTSHREGLQVLLLHWKNSFVWRLAIVNGKRCIYLMGDGDCHLVSHSIHFNSQRDLPCSCTVSYHG